MRLLSIDASTKATGYAIFDNEKLKYHGYITKTGTVYNRIEEMKEEIAQLVQEYEADEIVMEDVIPEEVSHNQAVYKALMYLQGAVVLKLDKMGRSVNFMVSSEWRKLCGIRTGRGVRRGTLKAADIKFVKETYGIDSNDDECDAIGIGHAWIRKKNQVIDEGVNW